MSINIDNGICGVPTRLDVIVKRASLVLLDPDADRLSRDVVPLRQSMADEVIE